jgi:2'-hydroxyisoflavone reductase
MKLLILGGTVYLGRHVVDAARARGHEVTLFNRGRSNADLFPDLETVRGDRATDLGRLAGRRWDAVVDTSGYLPSVVRTAIQTLGSSVGHYTFVSSISAYADNTHPRLKEDDAVATLPPGEPEELTGERYGALKAACEAVVHQHLWETALIARAGLIFGPHDTTDRSQYWPLRIARGGEVLAPGTPDRPLQLIDVRDLAGWIVRAAEARTTGTFNATGPEEPIPTGVFMEACREAAGKTDAGLTWVEEEFLLAHEVAPYNALPLWVPEKFRVFEDVDVRRAVRAGLRFRPLIETLRDTLAWARTLPEGPREPRVGIPLSPALTAEREREILARWHAREHAAS